MGRFLTRLIDMQAGWARPFGDFNHRWLSAALPADPPVKDLLNGTWLGHPLHAAATDLPIGAICARGPARRPRHAVGGRRRARRRASCSWSPRPSRASPITPTPTDGAGPRHRPLDADGRGLVVLRRLGRAPRGRPADRALPIVLSTVGLR